MSKEDEKIEKFFDVSNLHIENYQQFKAELQQYAEQESRGNNKKHRYCPYCGEPLIRNKHKIWCNDVKEQEE